MRFALVLLYAHFFMSATLGHSTPSVSFALNDPHCTRVLQPLIVASQVYDIINTRNQLARYPQARESDWWSVQFAGPQHRNIVGIALGIALLDEIKWRLTAHSPALRCAVEANQLETTVEAIEVTHPR